ncbi:MAG: Trk system potassium transporter TrkA [Clostridiales bacterium]|nr:Trk system potassium transporter TrkA [Clostridiales bacterium]
MKIAIAGAGKLGLRITEILKGGDHSITLIDKDEELVRRLAVSLDVATVAGNAKEASLLEQIGIHEFDYFIAVTDRDEKNLVIGAVAKRLGVTRVIVRIRDPEYGGQYRLLEEIFGVDHIVNPDRGVAEEINKYLTEKYSFQGGVLHAGKAAVLEMEAGEMPGFAVGSVSGISESLKSAKMSLAAISKNGKFIIPKCDEDYIIEKDDFLYIVGDRKYIEGLASKNIDEERRTDTKRVMIAGGGKVGFYLARLLEDFGASVKIVEIKKQRCQYLSEHLQNTLVLNGDAADTELLENESFSEVDTLVGVTGFDEENLLLALMAKQAGIEDAIAKVSRESFGELITSMGVDMVVNPIDISVSHIVRIIDGAAVLSSHIIQGQAELVQIMADRGMSLHGKDVGSLNLPSGVAIIALQRGETVILPDDDTKMTEGDRLLILSLLSESFDLEKLLRVKKGFFA